jgi:hypothetical protein
MTMPAAIDTPTSYFEVLDDNRTITIDVRPEPPTVYHWSVGALDDKIWMETRLPRYRPGVGDVRGDAPTMEDALRMARWALALLGTMPEAGAGAEVAP